MTGFAVVDVETTGVYYRRDRVIEVGVILLDAALGETLRWSSLVNPQRAVTAQHVHGICDTDVVGAPTLADVAVDLMALLVGRVVVAHNAVFDVNRAVSEITNQVGVLNVRIRSWWFGVSVSHLAAGGNPVRAGC